MRYKTKVTVLIGGKAYNPGTILPDDISSADLAFLKSKKFVEPADVAPVFADEEDDLEDESGDFDGFNEKVPDVLKSPEEIQKIRTKKDLAAYAKKIGLELGGDFEERSLKELQEETINFQEEKLDGGGEDDI